MTFIYFHLLPPTSTYFHLLSPTFTYFHLLPPTSTYFHLLSPTFTYFRLFPMSFQYFHLFFHLLLRNLPSTFAETSIINSIVLQHSPFKLLSPTSIHFLYTSSTSIWLVFLSKLPFTSAKTSVHSHPTSFNRSTIPGRLRFALRAHGLWRLKRLIIFLHLVGGSRVPNRITRGWDQVRVDYGGRQKLLRTPMEVSLKVEVKWKF